MTESNPIWGLVICGGQSSRMGTDKSLIAYHGQPQRYWLYDILMDLCGTALISCNDQQAIEIPQKYQKIVDSSTYKGIGPMGGLLSAFEAFPKTSFLVIGCDYPYLERYDIELLLGHGQLHGTVASLFNPEQSVREPLIAFYPYSCCLLLLKQFEQNDFSLRHFLNDIDAIKVIPSKLESIRSADTPQDRETAMEKLRSQTKS